MFRYQRYSPGPRRLAWEAPTEESCVRLNRILMHGEERACDANAMNFLLVAEKYRVRIALDGEILFRRYAGKTEGRTGYGFPILMEDPRCSDGYAPKALSALDALLDDAMGKGGEVRFCLLDDTQAETISSWAAMRGFTLEWGEDEADADYLYEKASLESFSGAKFSRKRNWVRRFEKMFPDWEYRAIDARTVEDAKVVACGWFHERGAKGKDVPGFERDALFEILANAARLPLLGGVLYARPGLPSAFAVGSMTSRHTCDLHYEKGLEAFVAHGAVPLLNREFARHSCPDGCTEINFEEDLGIEGLRRMKRSYFPREILRKRYVRVLIDRKAVGTYG